MKTLFKVIPMAVLDREAKRMTKLLKGKTVKICRRHRGREVLIEFQCGSRLFVNGEGTLEISITEGTGKKRKSRTA